MALQLGKRKGGELVGQEWKDKGGKRREGKAEGKGEERRERKSSDPSEMLCSSTASVALWSLS
jgi:hypothetical protein